MKLLIFLLAINVSGFIEAQVFAKHFPEAIQLNSVAISGTKTYAISGARVGSDGLQPFVFATTSSAKKLWARYFSFGDGYFGVVEKIIADPSEGFLVLATRYRDEVDDSDPVLIRLKDTGKVVWKKTINQPGIDYIRSAVPASDGGYLVVGNTVSHSSFGFSDGWILKIDSAGEVEWVQTMGKTGQDTLFSIAIGKDSFYVAGSVDIFGTSESSKILISRIALDGQIIWAKSIYPEGGSAQAFSVTALKEGGCIIAGTYVHSNALGDQDAFIARLNDRGGIVWKKRILGPGQEVLFSVRQDSEGNILAGGQTISAMNGLLIKLSIKGRIIASLRLDNPSGAQVSDILETPDGFYLATGGYGTVSENYWAIMLKFTPDFQSGKCNLFGVVNLKTRSPKLRKSSAILGDQISNVTLQPVSIKSGKVSLGWKSPCNTS